MSIDFDSFIPFLVEAKKNTYAAQGVDASVPPSLNGSKQLEYRCGNYFYRDIYFGSAFFTGQEVVEYENRPIWSMVYSGGVLIPNASLEQTAPIYAFLREALRLVDELSIYRGPSFYQKQNYIYENQSNGTLDYFYGNETILIDGKKVYELRYSGGFIR
jgi:hypothetical protein